MSCCAHCEDAGDLFNREKAQNELRKYRTSGPPNKSTRLLIDALKTLDLQGRTLLDIGGGVGMIPLELLGAGVSASTLVEASPAYLDVAEQEARRRGFENRTAYEYGDFVERAPDLPEADIVTLDRVFCCYPHLEELVEASTSKTARWYGVTYPKERWYNQVIGGLAGVYCWVRDMDFRMYIHTGVEEVIRANGFVPFYQVNTILWRVELYEREDGAADDAG
ncbi:MAG: class I SAM-dependent methyltransferase [Salinibacter sp.]|uniref:class I SAM-dependent methyltransferase n=1 Tax=Salinibacter sp. TaxID=2065818 RepID=UPI0035D47AF9